MIKNWVLVVSLFFIVVNLKGQSQNVSVEDQLFGVKLSAFIPSLDFVYEKKLTNKSVFELKAGASFGFSFSKSDISFKDTEVYSTKSSSYSISPDLSLSYKYFYNLNKRFAKGKNIANNSANYLSISLHNYFGGYVNEKYEDNLNTSHTYRRDYYSKDYVLLFVPKWGLNRSLGNKFTYNFEIGPSVATDFEKTNFGLWIQTGFAYIFK